MKYPLIEKWLGLLIHEYPEGFYVKAAALEAKLAEGFEVHGYCDQWSNEQSSADTHTGLIIGKQPIKKKTREEAALEFIQWISEGIYPSDVTGKAKEILEMK